MRGRWLSSVMVVGSVLALASGPWDLARLGADEDAGVVWLDDVASAQSEAQRTGRPLFLVFRCVP